jgi:imidazolonepropionase-like amidohydrolase
MQTVHRAGSRSFRHMKNKMRVTMGNQMWFLFFTLALLAPAVTLPAEEAVREVTVIHAERVFTGSEVLEDLTLVIEGERIAQIMPRASYVPIPGCRTLEAAGQTVAPGFIDAHVHILSMPLQYLRNVAKYGWGRIVEETLSLVPGNRLDYLKSGVTTVLDMGAPLPDLVRMKRRLENGKILGPDLFFSGPPFTAPNGHPAGTIYRGMHQLIDQGTVQVADAGPALGAVARLQDRGVNFIKLIYDDGALYTTYAVPRLDPLLARQITAAAHESGLRAIAHVGATEAGFRDMIACGVDGVEHCFAYNGSEEVFRELAARGVFFTPTLSIYELFSPQVLPRMQESVRRAYEQGVTIAAGTDFPSTKFKDAGAGFYRELALLEQAGLPRLEVLKAATVNGARKLGFENEAGSIAEGHRANLIFVAGDIREGELSPARIGRVMLHGRTIVDNGEVEQNARAGFKKRSIIASPFGFYEPVGGFSFGANLLHFDLFNTGIAANVNATYSLRNFFGAELSLFTPSPIPKTYLDFRFRFDGYAKRYFGLSNEATLADAVEFASNSYQAAVRTATPLSKTFRLGTELSLDYRAIDGSVLPAVPGADGGLGTLLGVELARDRRDAPGAPWYGDYEAVSLALSTPYLGSDWSFATLALDARLFFSILHNHVIAGRLLYRQCFGEAPFYDRPDFGGNLLGRGFQPGRFIGDIGLAAQLEYRFPIWSILGGVLFVDAGQVQDQFTSFAFDGIHLTGGFGIRLAFSDNSILAFDFGFNGEPFSKEGFTIVFHNGHAF